ncbi:MAG: DUF454 domain-containing protein [Spirochaetaceae bacterium]|nr:MAG: DUF454 domain-containing protein [Spirochaetaceae bacterium]
MIRRIILITAGFTSLAAGIIGIFLPLLPTTPFLLLSAACFFNSSKRLYSWITGHRIFGKYIRSYRQFKAVSLRAKIFAVVLLWLTIGVSIFVFFDRWYVWISLLLVATLVTIHILRLRTLTKAMLDAVSNETETTRF